MVHNNARSREDMFSEGDDEDFIYHVEQPSGLGVILDTTKPFGKIPAPSLIELHNHGELSGHLSRAWCRLGEGCPDCI